MGIFGTRFSALAICIFLGINTAAAQVLSVSETEAEQRKEAAGFVLSRESSIAIIIGECGNFLSGATPSLELIFRGWYDRNRSELQAAYVWTDRYLSELKTTNPTLHQRMSNELMQSLSNAGLETTRAIFRRQLPNQKSCEFAVKQYELPELDIKNIAQNPGYERYGKFAQTLSSIRSEPGFSIPTHLHWGYENAARFKVGISNMASLDAAEAAKEHGDGPARIAAFQSMAQRGDGAAAQSIGMMFLKGNLVPKDVGEAYRWFYAAWSLSEYEGLNAMGVMLRDGLGIKRNLPLAQASFMLATVAAKSQSAHDRALANSKQLAAQISGEDATQIACLSLGSLDEVLRKPIQLQPKLVQGKPITGAERRLGILIKELSPNFYPDSCK